MRSRRALSHSVGRSDGMMTREGMGGDAEAVARSCGPELPVRDSGGGLCSLSLSPCSSSSAT